VGVAIKREKLELREGERLRELCARIWDAVQGRIDRGEFDALERRLRPEAAITDRLPGNRTVTLRLPRKSRERQLVIRN
jgi:hypothetical protein